MLTSEQLATFQQDGALVVPGVLGGDWLKRVRGDFDFRVDDLLARYNLPGGGDFCAKMFAPHACQTPRCEIANICPIRLRHIDISLPLAIWSMCS